MFYGVVLDEMKQNLPKYDPWKCLICKIQNGRIRNKRPHFVNHYICLIKASSLF